LFKARANEQVVEKHPLTSLPQKVQTLTYEKIRIGLELLLRLVRGVFEQPAAYDILTACAWVHFAEKWWMGKARLSSLLIHQSDEIVQQTQSLPESLGGVVGILEKEV
jgi:hypothetical protein